MRIWIPMPLQIVIDDVGWWCGRNEGQQGGPFRTGMGRDHVPEDYKALVSLGKALGMRPQAAMVLCEWDRTNLLRGVPTSTWMGENWDNRHRIGPWLDEASEILSDGAEHLEITLHGLGHEYWEEGKRSRAEWHDKRGHMRPREVVESHLDAYFKIMEQNGIDGNLLSFVPCAFLHALGDEKEGFAKICKARGIRYISTPFVRMRNAKEPEDRWFGIDHGIITVDRGDAGIRWDTVTAAPPKAESGTASLPRQPILGLHWPNLLHPEPGRNQEVVNRWISSISSASELPDRILSPDTPSCWTQLVYNRLTKLHAGNQHSKIDGRGHPSTETISLSRGETLILDFTKIDALGGPAELSLKDSFTLHYETEAGGPAEPEVSGCTIVSKRSLPRENSEKPYRTLTCKRKPETSTATLRLRKRNH